MRRTALSLSLLLVFGYPANLLATSAPPAEPGTSYPVPAIAAPPNSTSERAAAWAGLSSPEQQQYIDNFWANIVAQTPAPVLESRGAEGPAEEPASGTLFDGAVERRAPGRVSGQAPALVKGGGSTVALPPPCLYATAACPCAGLRDAPAEKPPLVPEVDAVNIVASPTSGTAPLTVYFSVSWSQPIGSYWWSFGDGGSSSSASPSHVYSSAGTYTVSLTVTHATYCSEYSDTQGITVSSPPVPGPDLDQDGLADQFETDLAYAFRPTYHVSWGELSGTGFANFADSVPQTPIQVFGSTPARNHLRIKPLGKTWYNGQQLGFIQIDYFTMWNRDDGLVVSSLCIWLTGGIAGFLEPVVSFNHALDNERSAVLVAAPTVGGAYSTSPAAYKAYDYYTAAHEDTVNDKSLYFAPSSPVPAYWSVLLGLSLSKHATYPFNPEGLPLAPAWVIYQTYDWIDYLYFTGQIDFWDYLIYLYIADVIFYACWVEHFIEQGGALPAASVNMGDVGHAINSSGFIETQALRNKLNKILWYVN